MTQSLSIVGGLVVTSVGTAPRDVHVEDGVVVGITPPNQPNPPGEVVDASGLLVLPGMIDTHVHLMDPGDDTRESFPQGTSAAAASGVTTIVEHTHGWPVVDIERLETKLAHLAGRSKVDYGLAAHAWPGRVEEIAPLWAAGVSFFKIFTCTTHGIPGFAPDALIEVMSRIAAVDGACLVHCEDESVTHTNELRLRQAGFADGAVLPAWRSREAELVAVNVVGVAARLSLARPPIAHVSSVESLRDVIHQRQRGADVVAETCPQYLVLDESEANREGAFRKFTPPARIRSEYDQDEMWRAVNSGEIHHISSDHAPSTRAQKLAGDIWDVHFGLPGIDTTFAVLLDAALSRRISLQRLVEIYCLAPARRYRLKNKGGIRIGGDADLVLVDPTVRRQITDEMVRSKAGWTPYAGRQVNGTVVRTILRGRTIFDGERVGEDYIGRFIPGPGAIVGSGQISPGAKATSGS